MFRFLNPFLLSSDFDASFSEPEEPVAGCGSVGVSISTSAVLAFNNLSFDKIKLALVRPSAIAAFRAP